MKNSKLKVKSYSIELKPKWALILCLLNNMAGLNKHEFSGNNTLSLCVSA